MKNLWTLLVITVIVLFGSQSAPAIVGGQVDNQGQFPNTGAILLVIPPASNPNLPVPRVFCSCTLIAPNVVLTAGHCTANIELGISLGEGTLANFRVSFGVDAFDPATWLEVDAVMTHPEYEFEPTTAQQLNTDLGAIILSEAVNDVEPAALPTPGMLDAMSANGDLESGPGGTVFSLAGYGRVDPSIPADGLRRFAQTGYMSLTPQWLMVNENAALGFGAGLGQDSGGSLFHTAADGSPILVGTNVGSSSFISGTVTGVGWSMRLDTPQMLDFIADVLAAAEP